MAIENRQSPSPLLARRARIVVFALLALLAFVCILLIDSHVRQRMSSLEPAPATSSTTPSTHR